MGKINPTNRNIKYSPLIRAVNKQKGAVGENREEWNGVFRQGGWGGVCRAQAAHPVLG